MSPVPPSLFPKFSFSSMLSNWKSILFLHSSSWGNEFILRIIFCYSSRSIWLPGNAFLYVSNWKFFSFHFRIVHEIVASLIWLQRSYIFSVFTVLVSFPGDPLRLFSERPFAKLLFLQFFSNLSKTFCFIFSAVNFYLHLNLKLVSIMLYSRPTFRYKEVLLVV